ASSPHPFSAAVWGRDRIRTVDSNRASPPRSGAVRGVRRGVMLRWLKGDANRSKESKAFCTVTEGLQRIYREKILPVEKETDYHWFYSPELTDADFASRPMWRRARQYSTGKSTFIRHILGRDYPGLRMRGAGLRSRGIGPRGLAPTTDKFVAVVHGDHDQVIPGNALVVDKSMPFTQLSHFGNAFLSRFEAAKLNSAVLEGISLIDSPGVLAGEKQRVNRGYEFEAVTKWFADRVDMILVLFDVSKLDISDEFRRVLLAIKGNDHKIHMVLNKADRVTTPQLMRVYGAMMWSLGKVIDTPEVSRVYIGSFWDEPLTNDEQRRLFESEENELYTALAKLPRGAAVRKLNDLIKRARLAKVHAYIIDYLKRKMPTMFGKSKEKEKLIANLTQHYQEIAKERGLPLGDFPDPRMMQEKLASVDFSKFAKVDKRKIDTLDLMLSHEIPKLLQLIPEEVSQVSDAVLNQVGPEASPFAVMKVNGQTETSVYQTQWLVPPNPEEYKADFVQLGPNAAGKVSGQRAKTKLVESKLPSNILHKVWTLADTDKDGMLTLYEYSLAMHFIKMKLDGQDRRQAQGVRERARAFSGGSQAPLPSEKRSEPSPEARSSSQNVGGLLRSPAAFRERLLLPPSAPRSPPTGSSGHSSGAHAPLVGRHGVRRRGALSPPGPSSRRRGEPKTA
ncbi:unnamed protein product, partial [Prorocentrum cordatum]